MARYQLLVCEPNKPPRTVPVTQSLAVGRSSRSDVVVGDEEVSREQLKLLLDGESLTLQSLGKSNFTIVDGRTVPPGEIVPLHIGSSIRAGRTRFEIQGDAAGEAPTMVPTTPKPAQPPSNPGTFDLPPGAQRFATPPAGTPAQPPAAPKQDPLPSNPGTFELPRGGGRFQPPPPAPAAPPPAVPPAPPVPPPAPPAPKSDSYPSGAGTFELPRGGGRFQPPPPAAPPAPPAAPPTPPPPAPKADAYPSGAGTFELPRGGGRFQPPPPPPAAPTPPPAPTPPAPPAPPEPPAAVSKPSTANRAVPSTVAYGATDGGTKPRAPVAIPPGSSPRLFVRSQSLRRTMRVPMTPARIGRSAEAEVPLADESVSEFHASITYDGAAWHVRDLGSRNGTVVDGQLVKDDQRPVRRNSSLRLGAVQALFLVDEPERLQDDLAHELRALRRLARKGALSKAELRQIEDRLRRDARATAPEIVLKDTAVELAAWTEALADTARVSAWRRLWQRLFGRRQPPPKP